MALSFKYKPVKLQSGKTIYRPIIPITFNGNSENIDIFGLLDSGSDVTIIPIDLAEVFGVKFLGEDKMGGITNIKLKANQRIIPVIFGKHYEKFTFKIHIFVPIDKNFILFDLEAIPRDPHHPFDIIEPFIFGIPKDTERNCTE